MLKRGEARGLLRSQSNQIHQPPVSGKDPVLKQKVERSRRRLLTFVTLLLHAAMGKHLHTGARAHTHTLSNFVHTHRQRKPYARVWGALLMEAGDILAHFLLLP